MNVQDKTVLRTVITEGFVNQRTLAETTGYALGTVNRSLRTLTGEGMLTAEAEPTEKARNRYEACRPRNAIILAAGFGMRMVPINTLVPKALLEVKGEALIERQIRQLHEAGITDITVVTGFMKERFEYLIDEFGVKLLINPDYALKNNLSSLAPAADRIGNTYIIPADIRCGSNPFTPHEMYSWYMVSERRSRETDVRVNRKNELVRVGENEEGNTMIGIAYILEEDAGALRERLKKLSGETARDGDFWEEALYDGDTMRVAARVVPADEAVEINTYEQLRELDRESNHLKSDALDVIADVFGTTTDRITEISVLKKGMTNRSFLFSLDGQRYIMRIPGEGTEKLISRRQEAEVYRAISGKGLCDDPVYLNPENGYKSTRYLENVRVCDPENGEDLKKCMAKLRAFHETRLEVPHGFDLFGQIEFYEELWEGQPSIFRDYCRTKAEILALKEYIDAQEKDLCLTHIDAVPDNFLFHMTDEGGEGLQLTDWEYAGMQDPHVDLAMFCVYSGYDREKCDRLIDLYFPEGCGRRTRIKIYCYIAVSGLLWSNWCEYKRSLGIEFGEYALLQYRYAKEFSRLARAEMAEETGRTEA